MEWWVLIPIIAILVGGFTEWLKFKGKQQKIGNSTRDLEGLVETVQKALDRMEDRQDALARRIENLEAIVTSQVWDVVHDESLDQPEKERRLAGARIGLPPEEEQPDDEKAERLARRLRQ